LCSTFHVKVTPEFKWPGQGTAMHDMDSLKSLCYRHDEYEDSAAAESDKIGTSSLSTTGKSAHSSRRKPSRRYDQPATTHSNSSLLTTMEKFVQTVDEMNETILVPSHSSM